MATFRVQKEIGTFVTVHKGFINDERMSFKAKGILLYLLSRPDDWVIYSSEIQKHAKDGRDSVKNGVKELEELGYIERQQTKAEDGKFATNEYTVYEIPRNVSRDGLAVDGKPVNGKAVDGKPVTTNNNTTNNNNTNNDYKDIMSGADAPDDVPAQVIEYLNQKAKKKFKPVPGNVKFINARIKEGYELNDFIKVVDVKVKDWIDNKHMNSYLRPSTLFNSEKFEAYLNEADNGVLEVYNPYANVY